MNFQQKYYRDDFLEFLKSFVPNFTGDIRRINPSGLQVTKDTYFLGESSELDLGIFEITHSSSTDARVTLAMDGFRLMKNSATYRALVVYRSEKEDDWRLSLMTATPDVNEKGKVGQIFSNPRRFSFFLGPNAKVNTPNQFLIKQGTVKDFTDLQRRFSIEVVNKEFYSRIAELFSRLTGGLREVSGKEQQFSSILQLPSTNDEKLKKEFAIRLIGRLVFCWFLKKKMSKQCVPLVPDELLSMAGVSASHGDYYHAKLEPLFFEVLNTPISERQKQYQIAPWPTIPFLNGGLFSPDEHDFYESGKSNYALKVPDSWITELFTLFDTYNFTIDENTTIDVELSVDPEMLGRIFENLLAEINPETGETARKSSGSFYTPRPIVEYMVDQSIKQYLLSKTGLDEKCIESLLNYAEEECFLSDSERELVLSALTAIKILDPACGSGAFPMGALQKIVLILHKVDPDSSKWLEHILARIGSSLERKMLKSKLDRENVQYTHKLGIIRDSVYGVDIQETAVEISKLRFFLSLIVDEAIDDSKDNRGIIPLPNLEFKFVCANTLIPLPPRIECDDMLIKMEDELSIAKLRDLRDEFFTASGAEKKRLEVLFKKTQKKMFDFYILQFNQPQLDLHGNKLSRKHKKKDVDTQTQTALLADWNPFSGKPSSWFDPEWMFGIKDGFDIVIANPPYIDSETMVKEQPVLRQKYSELYSTAKGNWDLYVPFLEFGYTILTNTGTASFITPNKWFAIGYGKEIRIKLIGNIYRIANCNSVKVFEAGNSPVVTIFGKNSQAKEVRIDKFDCNYSIGRSLNIKRQFLADNLGLALSDFLSIALNIRNQPKIISDYYVAENPCSVSEAYEIKKILKNLSSYKDSGQPYFRFVNTGTIDPFLSLWGKKNTTYLKSKYYNPIVNKLIFQKLFPKRYKQTIKPKLIISGMRHFESFFDEDGQYIAGKSTEILLEKNELSLKVALGILNSRLISFYIKQAYSVLGIDGGINFTTDLIESLPISELNTIDIQKPFIEIVDKILAITKSSDYLENSAKKDEVKEYKRQIDLMVYKLYGLTEEERKIIETN